MAKDHWEGDKDCPGWCAFCGTHRSFVRESGKPCCDRQAATPAEAELAQLRERHERALEYCRDNLANYDGHHHTEHEAGEAETCSELIDILEGTDQ